MDTNIMEKPATSASKHKFLLTTGTCPPSVTFQKNAKQANPQNISLANVFPVERLFVYNIQTT